MKSNHNIAECRPCLWNKSYGRKGCRVFIDKGNVILDDEGKCNARIYDKQKMKKLQKEMEEYAKNH